MKKEKHPPIIRAYFACDRLFWGCLRAIQGCYSGFWMGILSRKTLSKICSLSYSNSDPWYDHQYNRSGLFSWEAKAVESYFSKCRSIYVVGAGGGREVLALRKLGFDAEGCECNLKMVEYAAELFSEEGMPPSIHFASPDVCSIEGVYDGLIIGWGAYMHIQGKNARVSLLRCLRDHAAEQAPILLSFFTRNSVRDNIYFRMLVRVGNLFRRALRRELLTRGDQAILPGGGCLHCFAEREVRAELEEAGFDLVYFSKNEYGHAVGLASKTRGDSDS